MEARYSMGITVYFLNSRGTRERDITSLLYRRSLWKGTRSLMGILFDGAESVRRMRVCMGRSLLRWCENFSDGRRWMEKATGEI